MVYYTHTVDTPFTMYSGSIPNINANRMRPCTRTTSLFGFKYFVTFVVDDCFRITWLYLLKNKIDVSITFKFFYTMSMICSQFNTKLRVLSPNNGGSTFLVICLLFLMSLVLFTIDVC